MMVIMILMNIMSVWDVRVSWPQGQKAYFFYY